MPLATGTEIKSVVYTKKKSKLKLQKKMISSGQPVILN